MAEALVGVGKEDLPLDCSDNFCVSSFTAKTQVHREEVRLSLYSWSCLANPSIIDDSISIQLIIARVLAYDTVGLCINFHHMDCMPQISSGSSNAWSLSRL